MDEAGNILGIVHQERGLVYALIEHAGHEVPQYAPQAVGPLSCPFAHTSSTYSPSAFDDIFNKESNADLTNTTGIPFL